MKNNWLKDNITSLLALICSVASIIIFFVILTKEIKTDDKLTYLIIANQNAIVLLILGYYYVSSKINSDRQKILDDANRDTITIQSTATERK